MLAAGLPIHCVALSANGMYDTHSEQPERFGDDVKLTADTLLAFQRDLEARGLANRVLTLVWSEFRRLSGGLDEDGNLRATVDYRSVYCSVLEQWLGTDAGPIVPRASSFARI